MASPYAEYVPRAPTRDCSLLRSISRTTFKKWIGVRKALERAKLLRPLNIRDVSRKMDRTAERRPDLRRILCDHLATMNLIDVSRQHTHHDAAKLRTSANVFMNEAVIKAGYQPYCVSRSNHDTNGGNRYFYRQKDLGIPFRDDPVGDNSAFIFCDVDYYCDMEKWMRHFKPILMYTMVPETVCYRGSDYSYRIKDNQVEYQVSGGASYQHPLWDYHGDTMSVEDKQGDLLIFNVEQKKLNGDPNRRLIWLLPSAKIRSQHWRYAFKPTGVQRKVFNNVRPDVNTIYESISDGLSISRNGDWHSVELKGKTYDAIRKRMSNKTSPPVIADVERILRDADDKLYSQNAPLLFGLVTDGEFKTNIVKTTSQATHFQPLGPLVHEDGKTTGAVIANTLVTSPALFPMRGLNSDVATINGRINAVRNNVVPDKKYKVWANEFVEMLVPEPGKGTPLAPAQVRVLQDSANQQARYELVKDNLSTKTYNKLKAFIKSEPYVATNDPRNITTMSPELTIMMSTFTYQFKEDVLKRQKWYGPGKSPKQAAHRLGDLAREKGDMIATDFSRYDGTLSKFLQEHVVKAAYMRWCCEERRPELADYFKQVFKQKGTTSEGVMFEPGYGTRSGSPITTDGNTMPNAFNQYCALRMLGFSKSEAFKLIGLAFGDDGAMARLCAELGPALETVAKDLGLLLKSVIIPRGEPFPYLGRYFVDPAVCTDSFQDPLRTIGKLHTTANKNVAIEQALVNKAVGYLSTDRLTPIVGAWCDAVVCKHGRKTKMLLREEQWKCSNAWPQKDASAILDAMAKVIGIQSSELKRLDDLVRDTTLDQMPVLLDNQVANKLPAVVDDVVVGPGLQLMEQHRPHVNQESDAIAGGSEATEDASTTSTSQPSCPTLEQISGVQREAGSQQPASRPATAGKRQPARQIASSSNKQLDATNRHRPAPPRRGYGGRRGSWRTK